MHTSLAVPALITHITAAKSLQPKPRCRFAYHQSVLPVYGKCLTILVAAPAVRKTFHSMNSNPTPGNDVC
ncbi:hypothetical protein scyTo_0014312 [Scyliorhinus torazame]|uniref:Uncharacterized protein n=1 Tax=Scyliorhinus torazame TaxID=75743 RepID=A0A401NK97_SCYTO|nr:hypothetical protein [Scyliorhinus torazame]